jgi:hypothetical protein
MAKQRVTHVVEPLGDAGIVCIARRGDDVEFAGSPGRQAAGHRALAFSELPAKNQSSVSVGSG